MKKAFLIAVLVALSLTVAAQKRVAVYVEGKDAKLSAEVAGEMVRAISQSRNYTAVNRSDDFSKQLQRERSYEQSGMVDDKQIAQLGRESGVDYVCAVIIREVASYEYSIEARLIDVETGDIKASDKRNAMYYGHSNDRDPFKRVDETVKEIGNTITNFVAKGIRSGMLQYSESSKDSKVVLNDYGELRTLGTSEVQSMLIANPEAYDLYEKGVNIVHDAPELDII